MFSFRYFEPFESFATCASIMSCKSKSYFCERIIRLDSTSPSSSFSSCFSSSSVFASSSGRSRPISIARTTRETSPTSSVKKFKRIKALYCDQLRFRKIPQPIFEMQRYPFLPHLLNMLYNVNCIITIYSFGV